MAEKIVILGNGFDLRHFLPTKYNHLITILKKIENYNFSDSEVSFSDLFNESFKQKDEFFYNGILNYYDVQNIKFNSDKLKSIQDRLIKNSWFKYLKTVEDSKIETWIDFETEINRVLKIISIYFESFNRGDFQKIIYSFLIDRSKFYTNNNNINNYFHNKLQHNILVNFNLFKVVGGGSYSILNTNFILSIDDEIQYFREKEFFDSIYNSLEEFIGIFNDYLIFIVNKFYDNFLENKKEDFIKSEDHFLFDNVSKIYSFNYTDTYIKLFKDFDDYNNKLRKVRRTGFFRGVDFLHGKSIENWGNKLEELEIVLGVDEIENSLKDDKLFQFTKYFQKLHKNTDYLFLDNVIKQFEKPMTKDEHNYVFYFWGHSLDISDKDYINDVFKIIKLRENNKIIVFYHSISAKAELLKNLLAVIQDKNIIEDLMKTKRLQFLESTPENLFNELA